MTLIQLFLVFSLAQLTLSQNSYQFKVTQSQVPPGTLSSLIHGFMFEAPSDDNSESLLLAASQFSTGVTNNCDLNIYAAKFNGDSSVIGTPFSLSGSTKAFCHSTYDNTMAFQKLQKKLVYLTVSSTYGTGVSVTSVDTATGDVATPINTESDLTKATDILDLPITNKIFLFRRQPYYTYQIVAVAATGGLTPSQVYYPLNTAGLTQPSVQTLASMQNFVLISLSDSTGASQLHILNSTGANASLANVLPEIILTDTNYRAYYITVDNINSDHIYCTFYKSATEFKVAAFSVSTLSSNTTVAAAITTQSGTYATFSTLMRFVNYGSLNFMIGVSASLDDKVYLYAKTLTNFGQTQLQTIYLPTTNSAWMNIGEASTYGVFEYLDTPTSSVSALIYHASLNFQAQIVKTSLYSCPSITPYFNTTSAICVSTTAPTDNYYLSISGKAWLPCATSRCRVCTTAYNHCDTCKIVKQAYNNDNFNCISCNIVNCTKCLTDDVCSICIVR